MLGRFAAVVLVFSWLPDCKGEGEPGGELKKFVAPRPTFAPGRIIPGLAEMCTTSNAGKRYWLEGYLQLPSSISIREGRARLTFYARTDGNGRGTGEQITVSVRAPGDIDDLWASATAKKTTYGIRGSRSQSAQIGPDALRIHTKNGAATARDKIKLTFDIEATYHFQTGELTDCHYHFAKAEKL
jgi:hypothetical protein